MAFPWLKIQVAERQERQSTSRALHVVGHQSLVLVGFVVGEARGVEESDVRVPQSVDGSDDLPAGVVVSVSVYAIRMRVPDSGTVFSILICSWCGSERIWLAGIEVEPAVKTVLCRPHSPAAHQPPEQSHPPDVEC